MVKVKSSYIFCLTTFITILISVKFYVWNAICVWLHYSITLKLVQVIISWMDGALYIYDPVYVGENNIEKCHKNICIGLNHANL